MTKDKHELLPKSKDTVSQPPQSQGISLNPEFGSVKASASYEKKEAYIGAPVHKETVIGKKETKNIFILAVPENGSVIQKPANFSDIDEETWDLISEKLRNTAGQRKGNKIGAMKETKPSFDYLVYFFKQKPGFEKAFGFLDANTESILGVSEYVKKLFDNDQKHDAHLVKGHIIQKYGDRGKLLCNLYTKGYIPAMFSEYLNKVIENYSRKEAEGIARALIDNILLEARSIYFVNYNTKVEETVIEIGGQMALKKRYIAIHSAGDHHNQIAEEIYERVEETAEELGYSTKSSKTYAANKFPFFDAQLINQAD